MVDGVERSFFDQTGWANLTSHVGLPSLVMPVARNADGLPIGGLGRMPVGFDAGEQSRRSQYRPARLPSVRPCQPHTKVPAGVT
jgi:hypothetical protein